MPTKILLKIVARSFYRLHAGLFLVLFLILFGIIQPSEWYTYQKNLIAAFVSTPVFYSIVFAVWLIYVAKLLYHTAIQLSALEQQFLFYSVTSFTRWTQFKSWFWVQLVMMIPMVIYGLLAVVVAFYNHYYLQTTGIVLYLLLLSCGSAWVCMFLVGNLPCYGKRPLLLRLTETLPTPLFLFYIFHIFNDLKLPLFITKIFSWLIINAMFYLFASESRDPRIMGICMLTIIVAHAILIYKEHIFESVYMSFTRNMPYSRWTLFLNFIIIYCLVLIPEGIWLFFRFDYITALRIYSWGVSIAVLFHILIYQLRTNMNSYLRWIFALFLLLFFLLMFGFFWVLIIGNFAIAFLIYFRQYYRMA